MAHPHMEVYEFIQNEFSPMIAVATTPIVNQLCKKNNLTFIELLQPFCKLNTEAQLRDPSGGMTLLKNLRINLLDINARPPQTALAREFLNYSVSIPSESIRTHTYQFANKNIEIPVVLPWFDRWRTIFLQVQFPLDHEFTRHYLGCMFVIASHENNVLEQLDLLIQHMDSLQNASQTKVPKWITNNVLKYIVIIHDAQESNDAKTIELMDVLKQKHGANNCHCLIINSRLPTSGEVNLPDPWVQFLTRHPLMRRTNSINEKWTSRTPVETTVGIMPSSINETVQTGAQLEVGQEANESSSSTYVVDHPLSPELNENKIIKVEEEDIPPLHKNVWFGSPSVSLNDGVHGACLLMEDIENIKTLVHEFCIKSLIPYTEKLVMQLTEMLANKKGVSRSIFSATKRWFTPNKPGSSGNASQINAFMYSPDSNEVIQRKLADLYFIFGNYNAAYQLYYQLKKDFSVDQAYLYLAGALEMAALSIFMRNDFTKKFVEYMEESINLYINVCKMPQFAIRATLFSTECLRAKELFGEAANQYIKMTSEDSDLRSALLLEQAAYCFLSYRQPMMIRKYAFHIVLAGHRFLKCNQSKHSLRCYKQASEIYIKHGWSLANDHIQFTIGRQAMLLNRLDESVCSFTSLLKAMSRQYSNQLAIFLKEYLHTYQAFIADKVANEGLTELPIFVIPQVLFNGVQVLIGPGLPLRAPGRVPASGLNFNVDINDPSHARFNKMEEHILTSLHGGALKKHLTYCKTGEKQINVMGIIGELIQVKVTLANILNIPILLKNVYLVWTFESTENNTNLVVSNEMQDLRMLEEYAKTHVIENMSIAALAKEEVVLVITPLAYGQIHLNGIAYGLVSPFPIENPIVVNGKQPIFMDKPKNNDQNTSTSNSFIVSIAPTAPALQVTFNEISQDQLAHEVIPVCVEIRNTGTAPLRNIHLATMFPNQVSIYIEEDGKITYLPIIKKSSGSSLIMWQLTNKTFLPGSSLIFYMHIVTPYNSGREGVVQTVNSVPTIEVLFYYENAFDNFPRYRVVRHQWQFSIQESFDVNIQCQPSYGHNDMETVDLCLTATNSNQDHSAVITEITLDQISLISNNWILIPHNSKPRSIKLQSQEQVNLLLKTSRILNPNKEKYITKVSLVTEKLNKEMESVCEDFALKNYGFEDDDSENKNEALLVVRWLATVTDSEGNKRNTVGQNHVPIKNLSTFVNKEKLNNKNKTENSLIERIPLKPDVKNLAILQRQVTYNMIHPSKVSHNFKNELICIIRITVVIHSAANSLLEVKINTLGTSTESQLPLPRHELSNPQSLLNFRWVGHSEILISLEPYTSKNLSLMAAFTTPGTYDLAGRLELLCRPPSSPYDTVMQNISFDSSIIIQGTT